MARISVLSLLVLLALGCALPGCKAGAKTPSPGDNRTHPVNYYNDAEFIADITIPDNSVLEPGEKFKKTWRMKNTGTSTWIDFKLVFNQGDLMQAPEQVEVDKTLPGEFVDIVVPMKAPGLIGSYMGYWRMQSNTNQAFGERIWVLITVKD